MSQWNRIAVAWIVALWLLPGCGEDTSGRVGNQGPYKFDGGSDGAVSDVDLGQDVMQDATADVAVGPDAEAGIVGCDFPPVGADGGVTAVPQGGPATLDEAQGDSQNLVDATFRALPEDRVDVLGRGPCGDIGVLLRKPGATVPSSLVYVDITNAVGAEEVIEAPTGTFDSSLVFDDACAPVVLRGYLPDGYVQHTRTQPGQWFSSPTGSNLAALFGAQPDALRHRWAQRLADGSLHVIAEVQAVGGAQLLHGHRPGAAGAAWTFEVLPAIPDGDVSQYRIAPDGTIHALYTTTTYPCDPCNLDLYHGERASGGQWTTDTVQASKWGDPNDEFATMPSMAIDGNGQPWVAVAFQTRTTTGSLITSDLRVYGRTGSTWCGESIVWSPDGYAGTDGPNFTGANADIRADGVGRLHVVFSDIAQWHDTQGLANHSIGQIRYAAKSGKQWTATTLYSQAGPTASPKPLIGFDRPILSLAQDASSLVVVGTTRIWDTDSIYNDQPMPLTLRSVATRATVSLP